MEAIGVMETTKTLRKYVYINTPFRLKNGKKHKKEEKVCLVTVYGNLSKTNGPW